MINFITFPYEALRVRAKDGNIEVAEGEGWKILRPLTQWEADLIRLKEATQPISIGFTTDTPTWKPCSVIQEEGRIMRGSPKHKKRRSQTEAYHLRVQKKWNKRWMNRKKTPPVVHYLESGLDANNKVAAALEFKKQMLDGITKTCSAIP